MKLFNRVAIIGVGLIGGSLGMAIKKKKLAGEVIGVCRHEASIAKARKRGAIDRGGVPVSCIKGADCVILATPVSVILERAAEIARLIDKDCIVTDVGSTKADIVKRLQRIFPRYVGTHPMAGSHQRGVEQARADLFRGSLCILTPTARTDKDALNAIRALWHSCGAETVSMSPARHDAVVSLVSHLPHAVAFSLMNSIPASLGPYASGGCRDTTRVAASDELLWSDIFLTNKREVLRSLGIFKENLHRLESLLRRNDRRALSAFLKKAKLRRQRLGKGS